MATLNKVMLMGRLTKDPELRHRAGGEPVANFSIATNSYSSGADGQRREFTEYHSVVAWTVGKRNLAQACADHLGKGSLVYVEGRLQTRSWEGADGQTRKATEIVANDVQFLESRGAGAAPVGVGAGVGDVDPGEVPF